MTMTITSIANLIDAVKSAGMAALDEQQPTRIAIDYKNDGSIHTPVDDEVEKFLIAEITGHFPQVNIISEESEHEFDPAKPYTFALDPIDGTDIYSQGMSGWCISLGLLDASLQPIAGIIYAPKLDLLLFADVGTKATYNQMPIPPKQDDPLLNPDSNLMASSTIHKYVDLSLFPGKIRSIGGAALHLCSPLIYTRVVASVHYGSVHLWDIAGAHAIILSHGLDIEYASGGNINYHSLVEGGLITDGIICGSKPVINSLRPFLVPRTG
jgi:fructose-1,6-bisphosphatase/inositol monophosphatase family enzyme